MDFRNQRGSTLPSGSDGIAKSLAGAFNASTKLTRKEVKAADKLRSSVVVAVPATAPT